MCIERAFGALKGRLRRLKYIDMLDIAEMVKYDDEVDEYVQEGLRDNEEVNHFHCRFYSAVFVLGKKS
jgi:hypothetical protein